MKSVVLKAWTIDSFRIGLQRVELYIPTPNQGINIKLWYKRCFITRTTPRRAAKFSAIFRTLQFTNSFIEKIKHRGSWYLISKSLPFLFIEIFYFISIHFHCSSPAFSNIGSSDFPKIKWNKWSVACVENWRGCYIGAYIVALFSVSPPVKNFEVTFMNVQPMRF